MLAAAMDLSPDLEDRAVKDGMSRRGFLASGAAAGLGLMAAGRAGAAPFKTTLHKAMIGPAKEDLFKKWKDAGFEGCECRQADVTPEQAAKAREMAERVGIKIHSVLRGWMGFNSANPQGVEGSINKVATTLRAAKAYGADAILVVPCRVGGVMPQPWEFDYEFDPKTAKVTRVAAGDNEKYAAYIQAQNHATESSRAALRKLIPVCEETGVKIACENVWNSLWVKPDLFAAFLRSVDSPWIGAYFDVGNNVKYHPAHEWIPALGKLILKVHIKDFKIDRNHKRGGNFCKIREGDVNWPAVRKALDDVGYNGWLTNESGGLSLEELSKRFDLIIAGK